MNETESDLLLAIIFVTAFILLVLLAFLIRDIKRKMKYLEGLSKPLNCPYTEVDADYKKRRIELAGQHALRRFYKQKAKGNSESANNTSNRECL